MKQHFVRVYVGIAIVMLFGASVTLFMVNRQFESIRRVSFEERMVEIVSVLRDRIVKAPNAEARLSIVAQIPIPVDVAFRPISEIRLSSDNMALLKSGAVVAVPQEDQMTRWSDDRRRFFREIIIFYALLSEHEVMVLGPKMAQEAGGFENADKHRLGAALPEPFGRGEQPGQSRFWAFWHRPDFLLLGLLTLVLSLIGVAIYFLIRPLERRIEALTDVTQRFGQGDLARRVEVARTDSIAQLGHAFNAMADRIKRLVEGHQDLLRAVSHEFRTPLARLFFILDEAKEAETPAGKDVHLLRIQRSLHEMNDLVDELLTYARLERDAMAPELEIMNVYGTMWEMPDVVMELRQDISIDVQCEQMKIRAVPRYVKRALQNLVTNAVRHAHTGIWVSGYLEGDVVHLVVEDDGDGILAEHREKIFEPFARLDESRNAQLGGVGLGLAIVKRIMNLHSGTVTVDDSPHGGARFMLSFSMHGARSLVEAKL